MLNCLGRSFVLGCTCLFFVSCAVGQAPLQLSIFPEAQLISDTKAIAGLRLSLIHGRNTGMDGLDIGLVNEVTENAHAVQIAGLWNQVDNEITGIQIAGVCNNSTRMNGVAIAGLVNYFDEEANGPLFIAGFGNFGSRINGLQIGLINWADYASGLQIGLINRAKSFRGIQIGAFNIIEEGPVMVMPILNFCF